MCESQVEGNREPEPTLLEADRRTTDEAGGEASREMPPQLSPAASPQSSLDAPGDVSTEQLACKGLDPVEDAADQQDC